MSNQTAAGAERAPGVVATSIRAKLEAAFSPDSIEVVDESHKHASHAHAVAHRPGRAGETGETHFKVKVVAKAFAGKSRVDRHRAVNTALAQELDGGVHALAIDARAPGE